MIQQPTSLHHVLSLMLILFVGAHFVLAVGATKRAGHSVVVVDEDIVALPVGKMEISVSASSFRVDLSPWTYVHEDPQRGLLHCRLPAVNSSDLKESLNSDADALDAQNLAMSDPFLHDRVASGIEKELSFAANCYRGTSTPGRTPPTEGARDPESTTEKPILEDTVTADDLNDATDVYELCFNSHFSRPRRKSRGDSTIVFGRRRNPVDPHEHSKRQQRLSREDTRESMYSHRRVTHVGGDTEHDSMYFSRDALMGEYPGGSDTEWEKPRWNADAHRWEVLMEDGDLCVRSHDHAVKERTADPTPTVPYHTTIIAECGPTARGFGAAEDVASHDASPVMHVHRLVGRCTMEVTVESQAVCEWDARLRLAQEVPILCNVI